MLRGRGGGSPGRPLQGGGGGIWGGLRGSGGAAGGCCGGTGPPRGAEEPGSQKRKPRRWPKGSCRRRAGRGPPPGAELRSLRASGARGGPGCSPGGGPGGAGRREAGGEGLVLAGLWLPPWGARCEAGGGTARTAWGGAPEEVLVQQGGEIPCEGLASLRASFILGFTRTAPAQCLVLHHGKCQWHGSGGRFISSIRLSGKPAYPSCRNVL